MNEDFCKIRKRKCHRHLFYFIYSFNDKQQGDRLRLLLLMLIVDLSRYFCYPSIYSYLSNAKPLLKDVWTAFKQGLSWFLAKCPFDRCNNDKKYHYTLHIGPQVLMTAA